MSTTRTNRLETLGGEFGVDVADLDITIQNVFSKLSPKTAVPTTRDNGTSLRVGDTYFHITLNAEYVYKSSGWVLNSDDQTLTKPTAAALIGAHLHDGTPSTVQDAIDEAAKAIETNGSKFVGFNLEGIGSVNRNINEKN